MKNWDRVRRGNPCPICRKPDWCLIARDGSAAICQRVESARRIGDAGWLHRIGEPVSGAVPRYEPAGSVTDFAWLARAYEVNLNGRLGAHATALGVRENALRMLGAGWDGEALTFPMRVDGSVVGIRRRFSNGRKLSVRGGKEGLFVPSADHPQRTVWICEGPTDTAYLLGLGLWAIGRPSCTGGTRALRQLLGSDGGHEAVIVADADGPGLAGAERLRARIGGAIVVPARGKDVREWKPSKDELAVLLA